MKLNNEERLYFRRMIRPYLKERCVQEMKQYIQHGNISTYQHCQDVARVAFYLNRRLHLGGDEATLVIGALLHDFYLYDWHDGKPCRKYHGFTHPEEARKNAVRYFSITPEQQHVIRSHMWPFTLLNIPKSREAVTVCIADKYCSTVETLFRRKKE